MRLTSLLKILAVSASVALVPALASAQAYPTRAIKIIVPAPPGGAIDIIARVVGDKLATSLGQPVIIDNKPGASNNLGTDALAKSTPDGYTIGIVGGSHNINKFLFKNLGWDPETSFEPIVYTHEVPLVFAIYPQIPAKTLPEFVAWMKAHPDQAKVATSGRGSAQEMAAEMFRMATGAEMLLIPYKGSSAAQPDLIGGRTALYIDTISAIQSHVKAGTVRAIAVSTRKRATALPGVPTADEQGLKGYDANTNGGFLAPAGTPKAIIAKLNAEINKALKGEHAQGLFQKIELQAVGGTPAQARTFIVQETEVWSGVIKQANVPQQQSAQ
jgi:tripartite-type tricarboxylate transporter receptor subunit TctC